MPRSAFMKSYWQLRRKRVHEVWFEISRLNRIDCSYAAINIDNNDDLTITGNIIENCGTSHAIRLSSAENCVITGNRIFNCVYSIKEQNGADYNIIVANNCRGNTHGIETIGGNTVQGYNIDS